MSLSILYLVSSSSAYLIAHWTSQSLLDSVGYIKASNTESNEYFGTTLALSGDGYTLAIGSPSEDSDAIGINGDQTNNNADGAGAV